MRDRLRLTFETDKVTEPVVCLMAQKFQVVFSVRRANIEDNAGWMDISLEADDAELAKAISWLEEQGVHVSPAGGDVMEG
ncbi:FeS-binding protein [bacterium]|nr:MAG: FeS-binding protein [bacterium]